MRKRDARRAQENRDRHAATRSDRRISLVAPSPETERLPVLTNLDEVLLSIKSPEPPMRDTEGRPTEARCRAPMMLYKC